MSDESDPPRKFFQLKPTEFEVVNERLKTASPSEPPPGAVSSQPSGPSGPIDVRELVRIGAKGTTLHPAQPPHVRDNDVHTILRENLAHANAAGLNDLAPKPKRVSHRKRQYWGLMLCGNAVLLTITLMAGPTNPVQFVYGIAGLVIFNLGLWWVMWHIMEDY